MLVPCFQAFQREEKASLASFESWAPKGLEHHTPKLGDDFWNAHRPTRGCSVVNAPNEPIAM